MTNRSRSASVETEPVSASLQVARRNSGVTRRLYVGEAEILERLPSASLGDVVAYCSRAPEKKSDNEDAAAVFECGPDCLLLAAADGVGGHPAGEAAAAVALAALHDAVLDAPSEPDALRAAVLGAFDEANRAVMALGNGSATTLAVAEIRGRTVRTYHVGDAAVLVFGGRGKVKLQTIAHSPVGYALEAGLLDEAAAMAHDERHMVSNVVGDPAMHLGVSSPLRLSPRDTVVVASDGLFDNLYTEEIAEILRRGPLERAVRAAAEECRGRMRDPRPDRPSKPDDLTLLAYRGRVGAPR